MWAMIPMLRTRSSATLVSATANFSPLPAVVGEGLVRLRHPIHVVLALERVALLLERVEDLPRKHVLHVLLAPLARVGDEPAQGERATAPLRNLDRHLVVRATDAAAANLEHRRDGLHGLLEHLRRRAAGLRADPVEGAVDDRLGGRLLALDHHAVDQLGHELAVVHRIGTERTRLDLCATRHQELFLAPYLERPCLRSATPEASSAARITL